MKFTVENLGKVSKADIDLKPLTIFIGKNGSGKTYVASALWAYVSRLKDKSVHKKMLGDKYDDLYKELEEKIDSARDTEQSILLSLDEINIIKKNITDYMFNNSKEILSRCFKYEIFDESKFSFKEEGNNENYTISVRQEYFEIDDDRLSERTIVVLANNQESNYNFPDIDDLFYQIKKDIISDIITDIIFMAIFGESKKLFSKVIYIPAARTGLMFGVNQFAHIGLSRSMLGNKNNFSNNNLTLPISDFVVNIHRESIFSSIYENLDPPIINKLIDGKILFNHEKQILQYIPSSINKEIPLYSSSSLVTETAALSVFNPAFRHNTFIIFEEPEAHLHLSAQREMAKIIAKMINQGCHMLITTHSDTFLQQLNNLIMLNKLAENDSDILQNFDVDKNETISGEEVSVYDFQCQNDTKSNAIKLELGDYGFIAPSVNDEINDLIKQTDDIIDLIDDLKSNGG